MTKRIIAGIVLLFSGVVAYGQMPVVDTMSIRLCDAEQQFLSKNLQVLAQKYNVDATKALIMQAKLYPNPNFNLSQGAYNPQTGKWFQTNSHGEEAYQLSQLIVLSHKIHKQVSMAETNYKLAEDNLYDLLRTLNYALRSTFFSIYYLQRTEKVYEEEINALKKIVAAYKEVQGKGYVAESEIVQVQAQLYSLQNEYQVLADNINDQESELRLILQLPPNTYLRPLVDADVEKGDPLAHSYTALMDSAYANRPDLKISKDSLLLSQQNYNYQKALAVPDITLGVNYDRQGSYVNDFNAVSLGFDVPIFNRNQGNIKSAHKLVDYSNTQLQLTQKTVEEQVTRGMQKAIDADRLYRSIDPAFADNFDRLAKAMVAQYMQRNVSLLAFQSFYDSYKQNVVQLNTILLNKVNALENLNLLTATNFFNK